jgi:short-subunit dehydrogenase
MDDNYVLITGASAGIGEALAREYARRGRPLVLLARRSERLQSLAGELRAQVPVEILTADLADPAAPADIVSTLVERGLTVAGLVNNAGYGLPGAYHVSDWAAHARFLQVMVTAVCELTWRLLPDMRARGRGEILNQGPLDIPSMRPPKHS